MNGLDLAVSVLVILGAAVGLWFGAWKQIVHFVAWLAGSACVYFFAGPLAQELEKPLETPYFLTFALASAGLFLLTYLSVRIAFSLPARLRKGDETAADAALGVVNRVGGAFIGGAKWVLYAWVGLSVLTIVPQAAAALGKSAFATLAAKHNLVAWAFEDRIASLKKAFETSGKSKTSAVAQLAKDPRIAAINKDPKLRDALAKGDVAQLVRSPEIVALLNDRDAMAQIMAALGSASGDVTSLAK